MSVEGDMFVVDRCSECGSVTAPRGTATLYCSGGQIGPDPAALWQGKHPPVEMDRLRVRVVGSHPGATEAE